MAKAMAMAMATGDGGSNGQPMIAGDEGPPIVAGGRRTAQGSESAGTWEPMGKRTSRVGLAAARCGVINLGGEAETRRDETGRGGDVWRGRLACGMWNADYGMWNGAICFSLLFSPSRR